MRSIITIFTVFLVVSVMNIRVFAHCEIPCGIYDDRMRVEMIREHLTTIEKSMKMIQHLEKDKHHHNANQLIRWVVNKENHAGMLQEIVSQYFLTQRISLDADHYTKKVSLLHHMLIFAMKCKQTTDESHVEKLRKIIDQFETLYFENKAEE